MWDPQRINNAAPLTTGRIKLPTPSHSIILLSLTFSLYLSPRHHLLLSIPPIHLHSLRYPLVCYSMKMERELESRAAVVQTTLLECTESDTVARLALWDQNII